MFCCFSWEKSIKGSQNHGLVNEFQKFRKGVGGQEAGFPKSAAETAGVCANVSSDHVLRLVTATASCHQ